MFDIKKFDQQATQQSLADSDEQYFVEVVQISHNVDIDTINFVISDLISYSILAK